MKEEDLTLAMLNARVKYFRTITYVLLGLVSVCVVALAGTIYIPSHGDKEVVILFISLVSGLFGALLTIVTQGIQAGRKLKSDEELTADLEKIQMKHLQERKPKPGQEEQDML